MLDKKGREIKRREDKMKNEEWNKTRMHAFRENLKKILDEKIGKKEKEKKN